jgi:hypothetical protein
LVFGVPLIAGTTRSDNPADELINRIITGGLSFGIPSAIAFALVWRPIRFALCLAAVLLVGSFAPSRHGTTLEIRRNFFGTLRVTRTTDGLFTRIVHGTTLHGQQKAGAGRPVPTTYYHPTGPLGAVFAGLPADRRQRVGVVGLGAGGAAAYAQAGEHWRFYEIDPAVIRIASNPQYFTYLSTCPAAYEVVLGDARQELRKEADAAWDVLVLDAFNSDSVPVHLLTVEAMQLYLQKLAPRGVIAFHVSNRYLDLAALVARVAQTVDPSLVLRLDDDRQVSDADKAAGKTESTWVLITRDAANLPGLPDGRPNRRWQLLVAEDGPIWRDDFSNLLGVWRHGE